MALPPIYKIHPAIGISRLGDAATFFIGPETPGLRPTGELPGTKVPPYKDGGKIKRQAARFRIFEYVEKKGEYTVNREVSLAEKDVTKLIWTVHLANRKASFFQFNGLAGGDRPNARGRRNSAVVDRRKLEIDPLERSISGKNAKAIDFKRGNSRNPASELWPDPKPSPEITTLGRLLTDGNGRLLVLGGSGETVSLPGAAPISDYANNDGWFDDVSDGPVTAHLEIKGKAVKVEPAWVICAPPDFAPHLTSVVTLYDLMYDVAARELVLPANEAVYSTGALKGLAAVNQEFKRAGRPVLSTYQPDFAAEIYPILYSAVASMFLFQPAIGHHGALAQWAKLASKDPKYAAERQGVMAWLREPDAKPSNSFPYMPKLLGDEPYPLPGGAGVHQRVRLTVTPTQYALLQQWVKGKFVEPAAVPPAPPTKPNITPEGLDRAALENCVGGAFFPGIEAGWLTRSKEIYSEPFRVKPGVRSPYRGDVEMVRAGFFTRQMALPWQADFLQCKHEDDQSGAFPSMDPWGWWPAQRPDWVFATEADFRARAPKPVLWHRSTKAKALTPWPAGFGGDTTMPSYEEMLKNWRKFGFVVEKKKNLFLEDEREPDIP